MNLYLASSSPARQRLLQQSKIPFIGIGHTADEKACDWTLPFQQLLESIVVAKMESITIPVTQQNHCYVVTVDTLVQDKEGNIQGKPLNEQEARKMIQDKRSGCRVGTAFCLDKKRKVNNQWIIAERIVQYVEAWCEIDMSDYWIDRYLNHVPEYINVAGGLKAAELDTYGQQFLKRIKGSYGALSLPIYEIRETLEKLGFFNEQLS